MGFFEKLKQGLAKTKDAFVGKINNLFRAFSRVDEDMMEELEEILITADIGVEVTENVLDALRDRIQDEHITDPEETKTILFEILKDMIGEGEPIAEEKGAMTVILVIGVNGVGKTTSIAKIANVMKNKRKKVVLAAADTFRAAAIDQLEVWADRVGVDIIRQAEGSDPAAVVFDACAAAKKREADVLIIDTAGRLHNKKNLMAELAKINRVIDRELPEAVRETLLVLDSTTGQNALIQAKEFKNAAEITGLVLTKLDGTAKGGVVIGISDQLKVPVKYIGLGEGMEDHQLFNKSEFIDSLFKH